MFLTDNALADIRVIFETSRYFLCSLIKVSVHICQAVHMYHCSISCKLWAAFDGGGGGGGLKRVTD